MKPIRVCLDANGWSAALNEEADKDLHAIERWFSLASQRQCRIVVPTLIILEVSAMPDAAKVAKFQAIIRRPEFEIIDLSSTIAMAAGVLRRNLINANKRDGNTKTLKTPDAIVVVSANSANCDYLLTDDTGVHKLSGKHGIRIKIGNYSCGLPDPGQPLFDATGLG